MRRNAWSCAFRRFRDRARVWSRGPTITSTSRLKLDVLLARIRALTRRGPALYPTDLRYHDQLLKARTRDVQRGGRTTQLTKTEYALLEALVRRAGCVAPRDILVEAGWGGGTEVSDNALYVFIRTLCDKIANGNERQLLHTIRGVGYSLRVKTDCSVSQGVLVLIC